MSNIADVVFFTTSHTVHPVTQEPLEDRQFKISYLPNETSGMFHVSNIDADDPTRYEYWSDYDSVESFKKSEWYKKSGEFKNVSHEGNGFLYDLMFNKKKGWFAGKRRCRRTKGRQTKGRQYKRRQSMKIHHSIKVR
jgi:hypothetical protein